MLTLLPAALALSSAPAQAADVSKFFGFSGCGGDGGITQNDFTVPSWVTSIDVTAQGDRGAGSGGLGAQVRGRLSVTPGQRLYVCLSVGGGEGGSGAIYGGTPGGGYASVALNPDGSNAVVIAGGGGGNGGNTDASGGDAGLPGHNARAGVPNFTAGGGGGADGNGAGAGGVNSDSASVNGRAGLIRRGGLGGSGDMGGGGGGAGVWGGGGGAAAYEVGNGGGGGGGTSYCDLGGCSSALVASGGYVQFSYAPEPVPTPTTTSVSASSVVVGSQAPITYTATVLPVTGGGTVAFKVDGATVSGCEARPVVGSIAECEAWSPGARGSYELTASYSGASGFDASDATAAPFTVIGGELTITPSPRVDFGSVALGGSTTRPVTVRNIGDDDVEVRSLSGIYVSDYEPTDLPPNTTDYRVADDACTGRTLVPGASCVVTVRFAPTALGERGAQLRVRSYAWDDPEPVRLTGVGVTAPDPEPELRRIPVTPTAPTAPVTPETPAAPVTPTVPTAPAAPATPPAPAPATPAAAPRGAVLAPGARNQADVGENGGFTLPVRCPAGEPCSVAGTLTLTLGGRAARVSAASTRVLVRFAGIRVAANRTRTLSLRLPAAFVKAQQAKGVRRLVTRLTIRTTLGSGRTVTTRQRVVLLIPQAKPAQVAAPQTPERPSFTG